MTEWEVECRMESGNAGVGGGMAEWEVEMTGSGLSTIFVP